MGWVTRGAGRMTRCQTVFEDVVKTICTTNCTWSATVRMVEGLVANLGEPAGDAPDGGWEGRAFPTPEAMAAADDTLYRDIVRCGYRGAYLQKLARAVVDGEIDLEALGRATAAELPDDELARQLLALPGVGPYAAAHIMMMLGRYSWLILDSWTRPTYARLVGRDEITDAEIRLGFEPFGPYAGLAFWLTITQDWVPDD
jgi:N-glycosylase/DNA lyase